MVEWAEPHKFSTVECSDGIERWFPRSNGACYIDDKPANKHTESCLAKMEQAMRVMEKWIYLRVPIRQEQIDQYRDDSKLWNDAKRECWRQP